MHLVVKPLAGVGIQYIFASTVEQDLSLFNISLHVLFSKTSHSPIYICMCCWARPVTCDVIKKEGTCEWMADHRQKGYAPLFSFKTPLFLKSKTLMTVFWLPGKQMGSNYFLATESDDSDCSPCCSSLF